MAVREVTINELEHTQQRVIWAINNSKMSNINQLGEIYAAIPKLRGEGYDNLHVPQTWLACELTDQIPSEQLLASTEFRRLVNKRLIILVDPKTAERLNNQPGAEKERRKLQIRQDLVRSAGVTSTINQSIVEIRGEGGEISQPEQVVTFGSQEEADEPVTVSAKFKAWTEKLESMDDEDAKSEIRSTQSIKRSEAQYLLAHLTDKPLTRKMLQKAVNR